MESTLSASQWVLRTIGDDTLDMSNEHTRITLEFGPATAGEAGESLRVSGRSGCNRYVGAVQTAGRTIAFGALGVTRMACPPPQMVLEARFLEALGTVANWEIQAESLAFFGGKEALVFDSIQIRTASVAGS